LFIAQVQNFTI